MVIKKLNIDQLSEIYRQQMVNDFPQSELKPLKRIEQLAEENLYRAYGLYDGDQLLAYACLAQESSGRWLILDYFAVCRTYRSKGYGSDFLKMLQQKCADHAGIFAEVEKVDHGVNQEDRLVRERRKQFYLKNGLHSTTITSTIFGVVYEVLYLPCANQESNDQKLMAVLEEIYQTIIPERYYAENVLLERD